MLQADAVRGENGRGPRQLPLGWSPVLWLYLAVAAAAPTLSRGADVEDRNSVASAPTSIHDKTLVAWVRVDNLDQTGSGVLSIQDGDEFDAITFGERVPRRWMAGSHMFRRTQSEEGQSSLVPETAEANQWRQIAVVYRGRQIEIFRDGECYVSYETPQQQTYSPRCDIYLGLRCIFGQKRYGFLQGAIDEARIYNVALDGETIAKLRPGILADPKPLACWSFDEVVVKDLMRHYPTTQLVGTAKVKDGALMLDGQGFALVSNRLPTDYRPPTVQAGFYTPPHRVGEMWDTWIYWHDGVYYMYYIAGPGGQWDAHEIAVSPDGVHWEYYGVAVKPRPQTTWIGTGHVWRSPATDQNELWILNYSEWVADKQDIMFATSPDLLHWTKVGDRFRFVQDTRWYKEKGRWDCIDAVQGDDGYLYGYFTADPDPAKVDYPHCGFGFARSKDGIRWESLPPVPGDMKGEFGGIQKIGKRYYITMSEGRVGVGDSPQGPFWGQRKNHNIFGGDIYFPRFFHTAADGPLMNHFYKDGPVYAAPLKAIDIDREGAMRLVWWSGNEKLKAAPVPVKMISSPGPVQWLENRIDVNHTSVMEGTVHIPNRSPDDQILRGIVMNQGNDTAQCISFEQSQTLFGDIRFDAVPIKMSVRQRANRDVDLGREQRFRIVLNRDMMEVYVNDYLTILARVRNTGHLGVLTGDDADGGENIQMWRSANESEAPKPALR